MTSQKSAVVDGREFLFESRMFHRLFRTFRTGDRSTDYRVAAQYNEEMDQPHTNTGGNCLKFS